MSSRRLRPRRSYEEDEAHLSKLFCEVSSDEDSQKTSKTSMENIPPTVTMSQEMSLIVPTRALMRMNLEC